MIAAPAVTTSRHRREKSPSVPLNCPLPEAFLKDVISETRRVTAERGSDRAGEEGNGEEGNSEEVNGEEVNGEEGPGEEGSGEEGNGEEGNDEEGYGEEGNGEEGNGSSFVSARRGACASGRNAIASRIHADRARPVGRSDRHRLTSGRLTASRGRGSGSHPR